MKIHLKSRQGMYTVERYDKEKIWLSTRYYNFVVPVSDFKCIAGGQWNYREQGRIDTFLSVIIPLYNQKKEWITEVLLEASLARKEAYNKIRDILQMETVSVDTTDELPF